MHTSLTSEEACHRIEKLRTQLHEHNYLYYVTNQPVISDLDFDAMMDELLQLEAAFPMWIDPNSPTQRVGGQVLQGFSQMKHTYPMLSLGNTYSFEELAEFDARVGKAIGPGYEYVCELKYDGIAIGLTYISGKLSHALTRGDGESGDDVTANIRTIRSIPLHLTATALPPVFEIRGEVFLPRSQFDRLNREREELGLEPFANPRNAAAGSLKLLDASEVAARKLDCYLYFLLGESLPAPTHYDNLLLARSWGFSVPPYMAKCKNLEEVYDFITTWNTDRSELPFDIDGVVIKVNRLDQQSLLGATAKSPRWAIAYKYKPERALTSLISVSYQVGRTGAITPVANLQPVVLSGSTVKRASLHNHGIIQELDIRLGDWVFVEKGGEIIPKIVGRDLNHRPSVSQEITFPVTCPECATPLIKQEDEAHSFCPNDKHCPPQIKGRLEHFISRKAMDVNSLGEEKIALLFEKGLVSDPSDLYHLSYEDLIGLEKVTLTEDGTSRIISFRDKSVNNILEGIEISKKIPFERVLYALGIRFVGETVAKKLAHHFHSLHALMQAEVDDLLQVPEVGEKIALSVFTYFRDDEMVEMIGKLISAGLQCEADAASRTLLSNVLKGSSFVVSGVLTQFSREEIKKRIALHGGIVVSSLSAKTHYLLAGADMGPAKQKKAVALGIPIISEEDFLKMIQEETSI